MPHKTADTTVVPLALAWQLHCTACGEPVQAADAGGWSTARSFTTRLRFTLQRGRLVEGAPQAADAAAAGDTAPARSTDPRDAALISGQYSVSYNATRCTLSLTGSLDVDGRQYLVDDVLTLDLATLASTDDAAPGAVPGAGLPIERLAGLAVMTHLGLREPGG